MTWTARPVQHLTAYMAAERSRILMDIAGATVNTLSAGQIVLDAPVDGDLLSG